MAQNIETHISVGSTADVPAELAKKHNIIVIPGWINFEKKAPIKDDPNYLLPDFFADIEASKDFPKTAAPSTEVFKEHWARYDGPILPIAAGDQLSGFYNAAVLARNDLRELPEEARRTNIYEPWNSLSISLGEGFPALIGAEMLEQGISIVEVIRKLEEVKKRMYVFAFAKTPEYFGRSGKISRKDAFIGKLVHIKPSVTAYNNEIVPFKNYMTYRAGTKDLAEWAAAHGPVERLAVVHTGNEEIAQQMIKAVADINLFDPKEIIVTPATKVVASHVGPDGFGLIFVGASR